MLSGSKLEMTEELVTTAEAGSILFTGRYIGPNDTLIRFVVKIGYAKDWALYMLPLGSIPSYARLTVPKEAEYTASHGDKLFPHHYGTETWPPHLTVTPEAWDRYRR